MDRNQEWITDRPAGTAFVLAAGTLGCMDNDCVHQHVGESLPSIIPQRPEITHVGDSIENVHEVTKEGVGRPNWLARLLADERNAGDSLAPGLSSPPGCHPPVVDGPTQCREGGQEADDHQYQPRARPRSG